MPSSNVEMKWNIAEFKATRSAPGVRAFLEQLGRQVLDACGGEAEGYGMVSHQGDARPQGRWQVAVFTDTPEAMAENARDNTLVRNFRAARG